jgi:effector-binding domain-containing protein
MEETMDYHCSIEHRPRQPVLLVRRRTAADQLAQTLGEGFGKIAEYLEQQGHYPVGAPFTVYHNMDMQDLDISIGLPVAEAPEGRDDITVSEIPEGEYASCLHQGPYSEIGPAYDALSRWVTEQGREPSGPAYELYLNDPGELPEDELQTQILFPLK